MGAITFIREKKCIEVPDGTTILEAEIQAGLCPDAPCGGQGKCGKCLVKMGHQKHAILTERLNRPVAFKPGLFVHKIRLEKAEPGDNRSDWERLVTEIREASGLEIPEVKVNIPLASSLYERRKEEEFWYAIHTRDAVLDLKKAKPDVYMAAFDIGTTTVVGYLLSAENGKVCAIESYMNPQAQYGADVIMRANYALENTVQPLKDSIQNALDEMLSELAQEVGIHKNDIYQIAVVGNTCMHHLFLGISPASLVHAPYTPAIRQSLVLRASAYGLHVHRKHSCCSSRILRDMWARIPVGVFLRCGRTVRIRSALWLTLERMEKWFWEIRNVLSVVPQQQDLRLKVQKSSAECGEL